MRSNGERGHGIENYLGVEFTGRGEVLTAGEVHRVRLALMYHPEVDYCELRTGATFTIREGGRVVGYGVIRAGPNS